MKQTENNEMDFLLRSLARRESDGSVASEDHSTKHLDADELNSYAEQVLPAAARERYTSHLADCASCRNIVSELRASSGASVSEQSVSQKTSEGFWQKLGTMFSPGRLRYAVPALALVAVIAVALVVLRQQSHRDLVAQNQSVASREGAIETKQADPSAETETFVATNKERQTSEGRASAVKNTDNQAKSGERAETSSKATSTDSVIVDSNKDAYQGKTAEQIAQPSYAPEPVAPPPPKPAKPETTDTASRTEGVSRQKGEADKKSDEQAREQQGARERRADSQNQVAAAPAGRVGSLQSEEKLRKFGSKSASGAAANAQDDGADTRTVSGRRFRRQGGIWIDTAFQSSTATTILTRGSEQFRAVVADEPGIRAIAAQLSGEVVVVWKGRAYRIR